MKDKTIERIEIIRAIAGLVFGWVWWLT